MKTELTEAAVKLIAAINQKEMEAYNLQIALRDLTQLKQQHPGVKAISFSGTQDAPFVELDGCFTKEALQELIEMFDVPMEIRRRFNI